MDAGSSHDCRIARGHGGREGRQQAVREVPPAGTGPAVADPRVFVGRGALPQTLAFKLYTRPGLTGEDARKAYGAYKVPGQARATTIGGFAGMTAQTVLPVTMWPVVHGTWDDPNHPDFAVRQEVCDAAAALEPFGLRPDGSIAAFARHQLALLQDARTIFEHAAKHGSRVCDDYGIDPEQVLDRALPKRVVIGRLPLAASASRNGIGGVALLPGLDAELLRSANASGVEVLAFALDHGTEFVPAHLRQLTKLAILHGHRSVHGFDLAELLIGHGHWHLAGFDEIPSVALAVIGDGALGRRSGITIDSDAVQYFRVKSARLTDDQRGTIAVHLLVRRTDSDLVVWSTMQPLSGTGANLPILISEAQLDAEQGTNGRPRFGLDHFFETFTPHKAQPAALTTRTYMNVMTIIAHQGTVGHIFGEHGRGTR